MSTQLKVRAIPFVITALLISIVLPRGAASAQPYVPPQLEPWVDWVLHPHTNIACPRDAASGEFDRCAWVSALNIDVSSRIEFSMQVQVFARSRVELPGSLPDWPSEVRANGTPVTVIGGSTSKNGQPAIMLEPGEYDIEGQITWGKRPTSLQLPTHAGIVNLRIDGNLVVRPTRNGRRLLLGKGEANTGKPVRNSLAVDVYRQIVDTYPLQMGTTLRFTVAGQPRLETLGRVLLEGYEMTTFDSELPARLLPNGNLQVQVEPGEYEIEVRARALGSPETIAPNAATDNWPTQEIWGFQPQRNLRLVDLSGAAPIDLTQTDAPFEDDDIRGYLLDTTAERSSTLTIAVKQRGNPNPQPNRFDIRRNLWLNFDGTGFVVRDDLQATINHASRMSASYPLGRVTVDGEDELINSLGGHDSKPGIELQAGSYSISAISEISRDQLASATGWQLNTDRLGATVNLPPGWRLLWTRGVDRAPDAWIASWSLWRIFVLVLLGVLAWRFLGRGFTLLLVLTAALLMPTAPFIAVAWLLAVGLLSSVRQVTHDGAKRFLTVVAWGWLGLTALMVVSTAVTHARQSIYPQLEHYAALQPNFSDHSASSTIAFETCLLYTSPSPRDQRGSRMPSSA